MPTGYTADVGDGTLTRFRDFALRCARAFGALILMRDDRMDARIPEEWKPDTCFYDRTIAEARTLLARQPTLAEKDSGATAAYHEARRQWDERRRARIATRTNYEAMLQRVLAWEPPSEEHAELKRFMEKQLRESIDFDCSDRYDDSPKKLSSAEWWENERRRATKDLAYAEQHRQEEITRTEGRNRWLKQLRESLPED